MNRNYYYMLSKFSILVYAAYAGSCPLGFGSSDGKKKH
jgi:hypothetical protein